jgi:hypothetical protein
MTSAFLAAMLLLVAGAPAWAQRPTGHVSVLADALPGLTDAAGDPQAVFEMRARLFVEEKLDRGRLRVTASAFVDGLVADRNVAGGTLTAAIVRPQEVVADLSWPHADLRVGYGRLVWGRLDELQPTDVVNPLDLARFFFEGRSEARMAVALARGRWIPSEGFALEGVLVPDFRAGTFDQLDEPSSPFNVAPSEVCIAGSGCVPLAIQPEEPPTSWSNLQGGVRASATTGRVDWAASVYRGFETQPVYELRPDPPHPLALYAPTVAARHPRFTMIGGDFETVRGAWGLRGETAWFPDRTLQVDDAGAVSSGQTVSAGLGLDRKAGDYRVAGNIIVARRMPAGQVGESDVSLVAVLDRSFARETRTLRVFGAVSPDEGSGFSRAILSLNLRDNLWFDGSAGVFWGAQSDVFSRLATRDFLSLRLRVFY